MRLEKPQNILKKKAFYKLSVYWICTESDR